MTGENYEERACGQILFGLKMSNLNYMVKETPYSAYITVWKKFVKGVVDINGRDSEGDTGLGNACVITGQT